VNVPEAELTELRRRINATRWPERETVTDATQGVQPEPTATELQLSIDLFFPLLALPGAQARRAKVRDMGYGVRSDFELNFGRYLPSFGRADDYSTGQER